MNLVAEVADAHAPDPAADLALLADPEVLRETVARNDEALREIAALAVPLMAMISSKVM